MLKTILPLSSIIALRFLGLFLVLPVISVYALSMPGATTSVVGLIVGGYAFTQMLLQVPFGIMSDKLGRKGTIILGLIIFAIGSIIASLADDIIMLLFGRFLQGAGAIGSVVTAMISDFVKEEQRAKAMAIMGGSIALSFAVAMVAGPLIGGYFGVKVLFDITAILAIASIFILIKLVPEVPKITHTYSEKVSFKEILTNVNLIRMDITNLLQKALMTFAFMIIPIVLTKHFSWETTDLWKVYIPAMIFGILAMGPAAILAEKKGLFKQVLMAGIVFLALSFIIFSQSSTDTIFIIGIIVFFIGFNMHEPIMQSLTTRFVKVHQRGTALGVFNTMGYFGTFLGGIVGGMLFKDIDDLSTISIYISVVSIIWLILIATMPNPHKKKSLYFDLEDKDYNILSQTIGVEEWYINNSEKLVIVKIDIEITNEDKIKEILNIK